MMFAWKLQLVCIRCRWCTRSWRSQWPAAASSLHCLLRSFDCPPLQVVYEELKQLMGGQQAELVQPKYGPSVILMAGLQVGAQPVHWALLLGLLMTAGPLGVADGPLVVAVASTCLVVRQGSVRCCPPLPPHAL